MTSFDAAAFEPMTEPAASAASAGPDGGSTLEEKACQFAKAAPSEEAIALANSLFAMAREGETERLAAYIDAGAPVNMQNAKGDTMLNLAAYSSHPETVRMLLGRGADPEIANDRGQRALSCAVFKQDVESTRLLLEAGADADADAGTPSARATVQMFGGSPELAALLA